MALPYCGIILVYYMFHTVRGLIFLLIAQHPIFDGEMRKHLL